jgi:general secretion pathway protein H
MPTSAAGNKSNMQIAAKSVSLSQAGVRAPSRVRTALGFTLIELLVVIALIAIGTAAVSFSLRDTAETVLERDAERLAALFESARARSRASGMPVKWHPSPLTPASKGNLNANVNASLNGNATGFVFEGLPPNTLPSQWLSPLTQVDATAVVVLGPDPIIGPQSVMLRADDHQRWVHSNGLQPFKVKRVAP